METKHTPGPWEVGTRRLVHNGKYGIAQVIRTSDGTLGSDERAMADARLIAAAPDLLASAKELSRRAASIYISGLSGHEADVLRTAFDALDAAIAKAEK